VFGQTRLHSENTDRKLIANLIHDFLSVDFAGLVSPDNDDAERLIATADPTGTRNKTGQMPGLLSKQQVADLLTHAPFMLQRLKELITTPNENEGREMI